MRCSFPNTFTCARYKKYRAHVNVFGANAPNEPVLACNSLRSGIPLSGSSCLTVFVRFGCNQNDALALASTRLCTPCTRREDRA